MFAFFYISFFIALPRWELARLGDIKLPWIVKVITWEELDIGIRATLQLGLSDADDFIQDNKLVPATGPAALADGHFVIKKCIDDGKNSVDIDFKPATGHVRIVLGTPDPSGDEPCTP
jgi:hypothetical protein